MQIEEINSNCIFAYVPELEPLWGAINLLISNEKALAPCVEIYGDKKIAGWRQKYRFLFECFVTVKKCGPVNILDMLLDFPLEDFSAEKYRDAILSMPVEDFIWRQLDLNSVEEAVKEEIAKALTDDAALERVFGWVAGECESFLAFSAFVRQSARFITEFFSLAEELQSQALFDTLEKQTGKIADMEQTVRNGVENLGPFEFSQEVMGKTFRNRGPYAEYVFIPSYLMPYMFTRYFHTWGDHKRQLLFMPLRDRGRKQEDTIRTLKAAADGTRYQILSLLAKEGPLRGLDIAKKISIATSTVSHHMEQLKEGGLITEEQVKNAKYYGLDRKNAASFLDELKNDFKLEE